MFALRGRRTLQVFFSFIKSRFFIVKIEHKRLAMMDQPRGYVVSASAKSIVFPPSCRDVITSEPTKKNEIIL